MGISHHNMGRLNLLILLAVSTVTYGFPERNGKHVGLFNYVTFPNDVCMGDGTVTGSAGSLNGDCYTKQECDQLGGTAAGNCAESYGVCCVFMPACGETVRQNLTYLVQAETQAPSTIFCSYTICPVTSSVNRIRLDFTTFIIGDPVLLPDVTGAAAGTATVGSSVGDCVDDTFSVSSGDGIGSPVICGVNSGQHVIVDTDGKSCVVANFGFGGDAITREYEIRVLQYDRQNEIGGPPGCLQFFLGTTGLVSSFNWRDATGAQPHLSNQHYDVCVRRARGFCAICWTTFPVGNAANTKGSFGLSLSPAVIAQSKVGMTCTDDYIVIPNGVSGPSANGAAVNPLWSVTSNMIRIGNSKYCGRFLHHTTAQVVDEQVCSFVTPFTLTVVTDDNENLVGAGTNVAHTNEASGADANAPLGTMGFSLAYVQQACP